MKKASLKVLQPLAFAALALIAGATAVSAQEGNCLSNREIQNAIADGQIAPLAQVLDMAGIGGKPLEPVRVCIRGRVAYYVVNILDESGQTQNVVLNAVDGSQL